MAVRLPSDLIVDVMRNADPAARSKAVARLQSASDASTVAFAQAVEGARVDRGTIAPWRGSPSTEVTLSSAPGAQRPEAGGAATYRGFEHMVLRNLFETLLPAETTGSFGTGPSAGVWRSMAADQLAAVYSERGGIGIAELLARRSGEPGPRLEPQWPYFSSDPLDTVRG